ncbi:hypothetical protein D3C84_810990 [compost metagenome]
MATQFAHIVDIQRDRGAFSRQIDDLGFWLGFGSLQGGFGFFQLGLARLGNRAVDSAGQCRSLGHQRAGTAQGGRGGIHITLLQHDLAAAQIGFGQLPLVLLKGSIVGRFGLQGCQLVFGDGQFIAGDVLFQLYDGRGPRIGGLGGRRWRALAGAQQQRKCDKEQITGGERLHSCDSLFAQKTSKSTPLDGAEQNSAEIARRPSPQSTGRPGCP